MHLPPGKYYVGDPCYVFQDETWGRLIAEAQEPMLHGDIVEFDNRQLWAHSTMYGDGIYEDQNGVEYGVDSGIIGIIPIELIDDPAGEENGLIIDFPKGVTVDHDNGTFWIGAVVIKTNSEIDEPFEDDLDGGYSGDLNFDRL